MSSWAPLLMPNMEELWVHPFFLEQLSSRPASALSLFWNLPPTQGPSLCFLASSASLLFGLFLLKPGAQGAEPHSRSQHQYVSELGGQC